MDYLANSGRLLHNKRPTQALLVCTEGIAEKHEEQAALFVNQGIAFALLGKYKEATDSFEKAIKSDPSDQEAISNLALLKQTAQKEDALPEDMEFIIKGI